MSLTANPRAQYDGPHPELFYALPKDQQVALLEIHQAVAGLPSGLSITVGNLKGGVGKTTTAVYLALLLGLSGDSVLLVDTDSTNKSALFWSATTEDWPSNVRVVAWAGEDSKGVKITGRVMADRVRKVRDKYRHVIIDTGPQMTAMLRGALSVTENFIIASSPYPLDTAKIPNSVELAAEVEASKADGGVYCKVLLAQATKNTRTLRDTRSGFEADGISYFNAFITHLQDYATAPGSVPTDFREYIPVLRELVDDEVEAVTADDEQEEDA